MKTPIAKQLPSGNWRVQIQVDGKRYSCTAESEDEAKALIVRGFAEPIAKSFPVEYAVEMNRLINLELEGTIG